MFREAFRARGWGNEMSTRWTPLEKDEGNLDAYKMDEPRIRASLDHCKRLWLALDLDLKPAGRLLLRLAESNGVDLGVGFECLYGESCCDLNEGTTELDSAHDGSVLERVCPGKGQESKGKEGDGTPANHWKKE